MIRIESKKKGVFFLSTLIHTIAIKRMAGIPRPVTKLPPAMNMASAAETSVMMIFAMMDFVRWNSMSREARNKEIL